MSQIIDQIDDMIVSLAAAYEGCHPILRDLISEAGISLVRVRERLAARDANQSPREVSAGVHQLTPTQAEVETLPAIAPFPAPSTSTVTAPLDAPTR